VADLLTVLDAPDFPLPTGKSKLTHLAPFHYSLNLTCGSTLLATMDTASDQSQPDGTVPISVNVTA